MKYKSLQKPLTDKELMTHLKHDLRLSLNRLICRTCKMVVENEC